MGLHRGPKGGYGSELVSPRVKPFVLVDNEKACHKACSKRFGICVTFVLVGCTSFVQDSNARSKTISMFVHTWVSSWEAFQQLGVSFLHGVQKLSGKFLAIVFFCNLQISNTEIAPSEKLNQMFEKPLKLSTSNC